MHSEIDYRSNKELLFSVLYWNWTWFEVVFQKPRDFIKTRRIKQEKILTNLNNLRSCFVIYRFHFHSPKIASSKVRKTFISYRTFVSFLRRIYSVVVDDAKQTKFLIEYFFSAELVTWKLLRLYRGDLVRNWKFGRKTKNLRR